MNYGNALAKPFSGKELLAAVASVLAQ